jgi:antitoxin PrlF
MVSAMQMHYHTKKPPFEPECTMPTTVEVESTLTERYQTTVPASVRSALRLGKRDKIHYSIRPGGEVVLSRATDAEATDPALGAFLGFLVHDISQNPERLQAVDADLVQRIQALTAGVDLDMGAALSADDE